MRIAERPVEREGAVAQQAGHRGDHRDGQRLARIERRQDAGQALGEHRFAGAGRADHQQVVAAGRRHFERSLGGLLAFYVFEIGIGCTPFG